MQAQDVIGAPGDPPIGNGLTNTSDRIVARLERLPLTSYQHGIFAIVATAWLFDSVDLASLTFVLGSIREEFGLSTRDAGLLSSMSFIGMFLGASIAGIAADRFGRTVVFQISVIFWGLGSLWCSYAPDPQSLGYARLLLGFGMGMEFPVALAIVCEIIPAPKRGRYTAILEGFWSHRLYCRRPAQPPDLAILGLAWRVPAAGHSSTLRVRHSPCTGITALVG